MLSLDALIALGRLTPDQREALIDHAVIGRPVTAIAADMGFTRRRIYQLEAEASARLAVLLRRPERVAV